MLRLLTIRLLVALALVLPGLSCWGGDIWEGFETAETAWQLAESDAAARVLNHERTWKAAHGGEASEFLRLKISAGTKAYLGYDVPPARAIRELRMGLWLRSDRNGPRMLARVVLPHTRAPRSDEPITLLIPGGTYTGSGSWQQLVIADVPDLIERQARVLRTQFPSIDTREAFIDKIILDTYTEPGIINLWIDDLELAGHVDRMRATLSQQPGKVSPASYQESSARAAARMTLDGSIVLLEGKPVQLRMIEHNGESLEWLQNVGFNAVLLREPASAELLADAQRLGMGVVAPPPHDGKRLTVSAHHEPILAWLLGTKLGPTEVEQTRALARELRNVDSNIGRPLVAGVASSTSAYSRCANMLFLEPPPLGGSFEMADYAAWFAERPRLARPGTPLIALLSSEPLALTSGQLNLLRLGESPFAVVDYEQLRLLTFTAVAGGMRGVCYRSQSRLDAQNPLAQQRADILRLINAELKLIEPWMASGAYSSEVEVDDASAKVSMLQTDRARLLITRRYAAGQQWVLGPAEKERINITIPMTTSSMHAYRLSPLGFEPLAHRRVTGGTRLTIENPGVCSLVVLTQDALVVNRVAKDLAVLEAQQAKLHYELTQRNWEATTQAVASLPMVAFPSAQRSLEQANGNLQQALRLLSANDRRGAEKYVALASAQITSAQHGHWQAATKGFASPLESPLCTQFASLASHYELAERLQASTWSENILPAGDMESLDALMQSGWRHQRDPNLPLESIVELAPQAHSGRTSLHLQARAQKEEQAPAIIESPPVWIISPPLSVPKNKLVRVRGFVRTSPQIAGSQDGVLIFDSSGGRAFGERIRNAAEWRPFTLFRAVPEDTTLTVTIALGGLGEAWLDDLDIAVLDLPQARETAPTEPSSKERPEEIPAPRVRTESLPAPQARGWWPRLR